ncbi:uncharacterized protein LOC118438872 [Folsomia candida]|uniref:uncharacterized protein LOC118438872 n=1 Tax=Folsomia candida TaxID=158441 RepID=UPI00160547E8|nr:uncharacterized protein LOC118438872 [Folsomia candida]XP_035715575.1 uncharacterized protein LOC118438872 [Folsomia candida]
MHIRFHFLTPVRSGGGFACCCLPFLPQRTRITIGNKEQSGFVEQLSFHYHKSGCCKDKKGKRIEFTSPSSAAHVGWLIASYDVANAAKIGLTSDSEQSPRFTAEGITSQDKSITIRNRAKEVVATGKVTVYTVSRGSLNFEEIEITLPRWGDPSVSEVEREIIFAVLVLWAINAQDIVRKGSLIKTLLVGTPRAPIQYRSS